MIFMGGWESGTSLDTWTSGSYGAGAGVSTAFRRGSQYAMLFTNTTDSCKKVLPVGKDELFVQFAVFWVDDPADGVYLNFKDGLFNFASVRISGFRLALLFGNYSVAYSEVIFQTGCWYVIEVHLKLHATDGIFEARVNGLNACSFTGCTRSDACVARWRFEPGVDIVADSVGSNTLINSNVNSNNSVYREGSGSAEFDGSSSYFYIQDSNLSSNFPLKSPASGQDFTIMFWFYPDITTNNPYIISKANSFIFRCSTTTIWVEFFEMVGHNSSISGPSIAATNWYHAALRVFVRDSILINLRLYNATSTAVSNTSFSSTSSLGSFANSTSDLRIGNSALSAYFDGKMDEMLVFKGTLGDSVVDAIRTSTYTAFTPTQINAVELVTPTSNDVYFDDVIINDTSGSYNNSWPNQARISKLNAIGDGSTQQFTGPFAKKHWEIMQCNPSKTFFLSAGSTGLTEILDIDSTPVLTTDICALDAIAYGRTEPVSGVAPDVNSFTFFLKSGSDIYNATSPITLTSGLSIVEYIWETSPISGVTWSSAEIDGLYLGVKT